MGRRPHPLGSELHNEGCCEVQEEKHTACLTGQNDANNAPANRQNVETSSAREELGGVKNLQSNDAHSIPEPTKAAACMHSDDICFAPVRRCARTRATCTSRTSRAGPSASSRTRRASAEPRARCRRLSDVHASLGDSRFELRKKPVHHVLHHRLRLDIRALGVGDGVSAARARVTGGKKCRDGGCRRVRGDHESRGFAREMRDAVPKLLRDKWHQGMHELQ
jgi:hypothetical protein